MRFGVHKSKKNNFQRRRTMKKKNTPETIGNQFGYL